ncbi:response regulator [Rapidithrix thailandica]|uniref:Response regulator n=1 Tax=Rapidithrix thailandica TaxID=413964 RepID=A0AAW9S1X0_9BACT
MKKYNQILIIDDDEINNYVTTKFIKKMDLSDVVDTISNGSSAINYLEKCEGSKGKFPDLIIVDISMPIMDGLEFLEIYEQRFWKKHKATKMVVITASIREKDKEDAMSFKCISGFLNKPVDVDSLTRLLK